MKRFLFFVLSLFLSTGLMAQNDVTFTVDMNDYTGAFTTVYVSGAFNSWSGNANPMDDSDGDGVWTAVIPFMDGDHEFKYSLDDWADQEGLTPGDPCVLTTGAYTNRLVSVAGSAVDLGTVCWNSCDACPPPAAGNVTFSVDMTEYFGIPPIQLYVSGTFNGWSGTANPMDDSDGDGIWNVTLPIDAGDYEFKYTFDDWLGQENFVGGEDCTLTTGAYTNRFITVNGDQDIPTVCWDSCDPCGAAVDGNVTFSVDMNDYTGPTPGTVYVSGTFNGWAGDANPMEDGDGDGVWETTIEIDQGTHEYKFQVDQWSDQENFVGGESCTVTNGGYTNRALEVVDDATLETVCWNSCVACGVVVDMVEITFNVNMSEFTVEPGGVFIGGGSAFGGPSDNEMTDPDGDGVYSITLTMPEGISSHYTFLNGDCGWGCKENIAGQPCADPGNFNDRFLSAVTQDTVLNTCFQECTDDLMCTPQATPVNVTFQVDMQDVTTSADGVFMGGNFEGWSGGVAMDDSDGDDVWTVTIELMPTTQIEWKYINGASFSDPEVFAGGEDCTLTTGNYVNRVYDVGTDDSTLDEVCFNACEDCDGVGVYSPYGNDLFRLAPSITGGAPVNLFFDEPSSENRMVRVTNTIGQVVYEATVSSFDTVHRIESSELTNGMYIVMVEVGKQQALQKFIVSK